MFFFMEWQYISSKSNQIVVRFSKLKDKKYRKSEGLFRFDGIKLFGEAARFSAPIEYIFVSESAAEKYCSEIDKSNNKAKRFVLSNEAFSKLTDELSPEGVVTVCSELERIRRTDDYVALAKENAGKRVIMLESVRDAGNMGTIIRSARAFGIDSLIISTDCADLYNSKTVRGAMGALFTQAIAVVDSMPEAINAFKENGARVFAAALNNNARPLGSFELALGDAIVIGNEGHGLSTEVINACNDCVIIPMEEDSESLNASIAASVCMWELYKTK